METTEQREKRLGTQQKQAALKRASETGREKERRLRAMRELAAKKRATESSQEKELRLRARRERAAVKRQSENRPETVETDRRNETRKAADNRRRNERAALFEAHRGEYLHNRGWANPENRGLHHEVWAQEEMAAFHRFEENLRHIIVSFAKKHGRCLLPDSRYLLAPDASETESRVDYILLRTTWILEASQQNYKALVKSRNC